jgi:hypothetical protein
MQKMGAAGQQWHCWRWRWSTIQSMPELPEKCAKRCVVQRSERCTTPPPFLSAMERAIAGNALSRLGDPRPGVGINKRGLPDILWMKGGRWRVPYGQQRIW